jgi:hypothetical protein
VSTEKATLCTEIIPDGVSSIVLPVYCRHPDHGTYIEHDELWGERDVRFPELCMPTALVSTLLEPEP